MSSQKKSMCVSDPTRGERILRGFDLMRTDGTCKDFTLIAQNKPFQVHKQLLAVSSEYFQGCFRSGMLETQTASMQLQSVSAEGLQQIIDFLYTGKMILNKKNIYDVLETAVFLHIHDAVKLCCDYLFCHLKIKNISECRQVAEGYLLDDLCNAIDKYVLQNFHKFIKTDDFLRLSPLRLVEYLKDERLRCSEFKLYKSLEKWIMYDPRKRAICTEMILSFVKFALMSNEELNRLRKNSIFYESEVFHEFVDEGMTFRCFTLQKQIAAFNERTRVRSTPHIVSLANSDGGMHSCILLNNKWYEFQDGMEQPKAFSNASLCTLNDFLFVCGGETEVSTEPSSVCYCFRPHTCVWTRIANMRVGRRNFALVGHGNFLYAIGGMGERNRLIDSVERYDVTKDQWVYLCAMGKAVSDMAFCEHGDNIFIAGGVDENCINLTTFKTFLPKISMWQSRADILNIKFKPKLIPFEQTLYLIDLYKTEGVPTKIESYDIACNQWSILEGTELHFSRYFSAVSAKDWIYFVGRNEVEDGHSKRYNMKTGAMEDIADFPWAFDSPMCIALKIPFNVIKTKVVKR